MHGLATVPGMKNPGREKLGRIQGREGENYKEEGECLEENEEATKEDKEQIQSMTPVGVSHLQESTNNTCRSIKMRTLVMTPVEKYCDTCRSVKVGEKSKNLQFLQK